MIFIVSTTLRLSENLNFDKPLVEAMQSDTWILKNHWPKFEQIDIAK